MSKNPSTNRILSSPLILVFKSSIKESNFKHSGVSPITNPKALGKRLNSYNKVISIMIRKYIYKEQIKKREKEERETFQ